MSRLCNCGAPESALEEDVQNPLDLLHTQRLAQKAVLRIDVRLGRPRRKLRFLPAASKDLDGQQVCTIGDHAEGAAPVPSTIEQQHKGLSESRPPCAHGSRTVRPTSRAFNFAQRGMRTARGHVSVPRVHHQRVVDDEHMSILPLNSAIKSDRHRPHRQPSMGTPTPKTSASLPLLRAVSTSSFIAALNSSYQFRVRELSETVLKEPDPCAIRLLTSLPPTKSTGGCQVCQPLSNTALAFQAGVAGLTYHSQQTLSKSTRTNVFAPKWQRTQNMHAC